MKTYIQLKDELFEEVSKIDISKLPLSSFGNGLKEYVELLKAMADMPGESKEDMMKKNSYFGCTFQGMGVPKIESPETSEK